MNMYSMYETDPAIEQEGIWADYGDFRVLLARAGGANKKFMQYTEKRTKPFRRAIQQGVMTEARSRNLLIDIYAETVILNWEIADGEDDKGDIIWKQGIHAKDGSVLEFNKSNVVLTLKNLPVLLEDLQTTATTATLYHREDMEDDSGNS